MPLRRIDSVTAILATSNSPGLIASRAQQPTGWPLRTARKILPPVSNMVPRGSANKAGIFRCIAGRDATGHVG